jgi:hypothetical protein
VAPLSSSGLFLENGEGDSRATRGAVTALIIIINCSFLVVLFRLLDKATRQHMARLQKEGGGGVKGRVRRLTSVAMGKAKGFIARVPRLSVGGRSRSGSEFWARNPLRRHGHRHGQRRSPPSHPSPSPAKSTSVPAAKSAERKGSPAGEAPKHTQLTPSATAQVEVAGGSSSGSSGEAWD